MANEKLDLGFLELFALGRIQLKPTCANELRYYLPCHLPDGNLYPFVARLREAGYIVGTPAPTKNCKNRINYTLTKAGVTRLGFLHLKLESLLEKLGYEI